MRKVIIFTVFLSLLSPFLDLKAEQRKEFFPNNTFDNFVSDWYVKHLQVMNEPSLFEISQNVNVHSYRFLWLRTFHQPIAIRLEIESNGNGILIVKVTNGRGGFESGSLVMDENIKINKNQIDRFVSKINKMGFWGLETHEKRDPNIIEIDGARWIFEGVKNGAYHVVDRQSPEKGVFRETGLMLVKLSKLVVADIY